MSWARARRRAGVALVIVLGLAGCGRYYWSKSGASLDDFNRDSAACAREASPAYGIIVQDGSGGASSVGAGRARSNSSLRRRAGIAASNSRRRFGGHIGARRGLQ